MRTWCLAIVLAMVAAAAPAKDQDVKIVLESGRVVKGTLVGWDEDTLTVEDASGKAREIRRAAVKKAYDAETRERLDLDEAAPVKPKAKPKAKAVRKPRGAAAAQAVAAGDDWDDTAAKPAAGQDGEGDAAAEQPTRAELRAKSRAARAEKAGKKSTADKGQETVYRDKHEWVDIDMGWVIGYHYSDDSGIAQLWRQLVPSDKLDWGSCSTQLAMGLDFDALARPIPWLSVGPFFDWNFWAPGAEGTLKWTSTGYYYYNGHYYSYPLGTYTTKHQLTFQNIVYGGRLLGQWPLPNSREEAARVWASLSVGQLRLAGAGYTTTMDGSLKQQATFNGTAPYFELGTGVDAHLSRHTGVSVGLKWQYAHMDNFTATIDRDDIAPDTQGQTITPVDKRTGQPISVDFGNVVLDLAFYLMF